MTKKHLDKLSYDVLGAAIEVHKAIGPGLIEGVYHNCLKHELSLRNIGFVSELLVPVNFKGVSITTDLRCDLFIENVLVVELKAVRVRPNSSGPTLYLYETPQRPKGLVAKFPMCQSFQGWPENTCKRPVPKSTGRIVFQGGFYYVSYVPMW
jgi:GxxExxY protein